MLIAILIILAILIVYFIISYIVTSQFMYPKVRDEKTVYERELRLKRFPVDEYQTMEKEEFHLTSKYGYQLSGMVLDTIETKKEENKKKVAVFCHGYMSSKTAAIVYAKMLMDLGFTAVIYDHRNHGLSDRKFTSMSYYEKEDLQTVVNYCYDRYGKDIKIVLQGESMGAATVLSYLMLDDSVAAVIADCGYSDLTLLLKHQMKHYFHLPCKPFLPMVNFIMKRRAGFTLNEVSPKIGAIHSKTPILFIHGDQDVYVPYQMSEDMYQERKGPKQLYLAKGAIHAQACVVDMKQYCQVVQEFICTYYT